MNLISITKLMQSFQWGLFRNSYLPCEFIIFEGDFYNFLSVFFGRSSCVPGIATNNLSTFFCCIGPCYVERCIFII